MSVADKCRAMGLRVGDTIEGTESGDGWWSTTRLTLLWLGESEAAWSETSISHLDPSEWTAPRESCCWILDYRDWRIVARAGGAA